MALQPDGSVYWPGNGSQFLAIDLEVERLVGLKMGEIEAEPSHVVRRAGEGALPWIVAQVNRADHERVNLSFNAGPVTAG